MRRARDEAEQQVWIAIPHSIMRQQDLGDYKRQRLLPSIADGKSLCLLTPFSSLTLRNVRYCA
jgi:hypothetical protein